MKHVYSAVSKLLEQAIPLPKCWLEVRGIRRRMSEGEHAPLGDDEVYMALTIADLKESHKAALALREQLQRRAQGYLMAVTVATSFTLGSTGLLAKM